MNPMAGYVYILINPSLNGIVKIGKTQNSPDERAKELSSATGVPTPFFVAYSSYFKDCNAAEIFVHTLLENNRLAQNREFFRVSVQQAIEAVRKAESTLGVISETESGQDLKDGLPVTKPLAPWKAVFHSANAHFYGIGDTIQDKSQALQLYLKAAKLGAISAYWNIGMMYLMDYQDAYQTDVQRAVKFFGKGSANIKNYMKRHEQGIEQAKAAFQEGIRVGNELCWTGLADIYFRNGHIDNWDKCWKTYFSSSFFTEGKVFEEYDGADVLMSRKEWLMCMYVKQATIKGWKMSQQDLIYEKRDEMLGLILWYRINSNNLQAFEDVDATMTKMVQQKNARSV